MSRAVDVVIVGAGLAGLSCARILHENGVPFALLEASDGVGGRVRTDEVQGFLLDRGFQVFLTSYPEARRVLDYSKLDLHAFYPGALVRTRGHFERFVDPWRRPLDAVKTLGRTNVSWSDRWAVARLRQDVCRGSLNDLWTRQELTTAERLSRAGLSDHMIETFFRPYFGGIFLEQRLETSSRMFDFVFRMMAKGDASVPARGMGAIPAQLSKSLPQDSIRLKQTVASVGQGSVTLETGEVVRAKAIVCATNGRTSGQLLPNLPEVTSCGVTCVYFSAEKAPADEPILMLNGEEGLVNNLVVMSNVAPSYAPSGAALISVTILGHRMKEDSLLSGVREQLVRWFGENVHRWQHLRTYHIEHALPAQTVPHLSHPERPVRVGRGSYVCGDHRDNASIQGAMVSGRRAAEAVLDDL